MNADQRGQLVSFLKQQKAGIFANRCRGGSARATSFTTSKRDMFVPYAFFYLAKLNRHEEVSREAPSLKTREVGCLLLQLKTRRSEA